MLRTGWIGWRGMVGSVLMQRVREENDLAGLESVYFSTSNAGGAAPDGSKLECAYDLKALASCQVLVTCQGGDYTAKVYADLRASGWKGYWIDAASTLRMANDSVIILDPVNMDVIERALAAGTKDFIGGNCTVSLMLMAFAPLFQQELVEWMSTMTYQAASGAGAAKMLELMKQMGILAGVAQGADALEVERKVTAEQRSASFPASEFGAPLAGSLLAWIDKEVDGGQTKEEWKGISETNKILGLNPPVPIDGICVRVGALRCHSQAVTIKMTRDVPMADIEAMLAKATPWTRLIENHKEPTIQRLTPTAVSGTLEIPVGRLHKLQMGPTFLGGFTVGDQLLWGAAEPLRRMVQILRKHLGK